MLPEKHPTVPNAHSKFEEIITAFVQVRSHNVVRTTMVDCHAMGNLRSPRLATLNSALLVMFPMSGVNFIQPKSRDLERLSTSFILF